MARIVATLNFNVLLEKAKLKDDGSNFVDSAHNRRLILMASENQYVLDAPVGDEPPQLALPNVMNISHTRKDDRSLIQCAVLYGLEPGLQRCFEHHGACEMFQVQRRQVPSFFLTKITGEANFFGCLGSPLSVKTPRFAAQSRILCSGLCL